jgi:hypothetical protein
VDLHLEPADAERAVARRAAYIRRLVVDRDAFDTRRRNGVEIDGDPEGVRVFQGCGGNQRFADRACGDDCLRSGDCRG